MKSEPFEYKMTTLKEKLKQGIEAAQAERKQEARAILKEVVDEDQSQVVAWLWLYKVVDSLEEQAICLENVLTLEPENEYAQERLARVKAQQEKLFVSPYAPGEVEPPPSVVPIIKPELPVAAEYPHEDEFDNELLCPYCTALTRREDRTCPGCRRSLIVKKRVREERTAWLWRGFFLQTSVVIILMTFGASYFTLVGKLNGIPSPVPFLPLYFGQAVDQPEPLSQTILEIFPLWAFWGLIGASLYSLILLLILYVRFPYGNVIYLVNATILLALGIVVILFYYDSWVAFGAGIFALLIGGAQMFITLNLWNVFTFKERRIILRVDSGVKGAQSLAS